MSSLIRLEVFFAFAHSPPCFAARAALVGAWQSDTSRGLTPSFGSFDSLDGIIFMRVRAGRCNAARPSTQRMRGSWKKLRAAFRRFQRRQILISRPDLGVHFSLAAQRTHQEQRSVSVRHRAMPTSSNFISQQSGRTAITVNLKGSYKASASAFPPSFAPK